MSVAGKVLGIPDTTERGESSASPQVRTIAASFLAFAAGYFLSYLFRTINGPIADHLMRDLHLDTRNLGLLTSVYFLTFTIAQLPYGPLVDRFGPRRLQAIVLTVGAVGAALFAVGQNLPTLILARALIGIGTSGALMAGLKALSLWVPAEWRALANGGFIMFGGLGAMASTLPVDLLLPMIGWRGVFLVLAGLTFSTALLILAVVPQNRSVAPLENWRSNLRGLAEVYRNPTFWRLAPLSASVIGTAFAVHGLWAARWLADVDHAAPDRVASDLLIMGGGLTLGAGAIGMVANRLWRWEVRPETIFGVACVLFIGLQSASLVSLPVPGWLLWGAIGGFGALTVLSYLIIGELFPTEKIGRANSALNVLHLSMAFVLQYGLGLIVSFWHADPSGHPPAIAYRFAFAVLLVPQSAALIWWFCQNPRLHIKVS